MLQDIVDMLAAYTPTLAKAYKSQPFNRRTLAQAFLCGCKPESKPAKVGELAFRFADIEIERRQLDAASQH
jgi:hypothetical protein